MLLNLNIFKTVNFIPKFLFFFTINMLYASGPFYDVTFKYYLDSNEADKLYSAKLFWAEVTEGDLNGIFFFVPTQDPGMKTAETDSPEMILQIPNEAHDVDKEYFVERPIASVNCYFIAKPDDVKNLTPLVELLNENTPDRIAEAITFYGSITDKETFFHMEFDLSIMGYIADSTEYAYFWNGSDFVSSLTDNDVANIFSLTLINRSYEESNFFDIKNRLSPDTGSPTEATFTVEDLSSAATYDKGSQTPAVNATHGKAVKINLVDGYELHVAGNSVPYVMKKIDDDTDNKIETAIRCVLGLDDSCST